MNSEENKLFILESKKIISNSNIVNVEFNNLLCKSIFINYELSRKIAANNRQKNINNIEESLILFDKKTNENKINIHWSLDYDCLNDKIVKLLKNNKIKEINLFETKFTKELGIKRRLIDEEINTVSDDDKCIVFEPSYGIANSGSLFLDFPSIFSMNKVFSSKIKIFIIPFSNIITKLKDIELLTKLYYSNKYNENFAKNSCIYTPKLESNIHIFIVDNNRTSLLEFKEHRKTLTCFDCDACKKVCPIYQLIGDKPYNNAFTGPYASVVLPFLETIDSYKHLSFNCVLCGKCSSVCPLNIPLKNLIISNRNMFYEMRYIGLKYRNRSKKLKKYLISSKKLNSKTWKKNLYIHFMIKSNQKENRELPCFSNSSLDQLISKDNVRK